MPTIYGSALPSVDYVLRAKHVILTLAGDIAMNAASEINATPDHIASEIKRKLWMRMGTNVVVVGKTKNDF